MPFCDLSECSAIGRPTREKRKKECFFYLELSQVSHYILCEILNFWKLCSNDLALLGGNFAIYSYDCNWCFFDNISFVCSHMVIQVLWGFPTLNSIFRWTMPGILLRMMCCLEKPILYAIKFLLVFYQRTFLATWIFLEDMDYPHTLWFFSVRYSFYTFWTQSVKNGV